MKSIKQIFGDKKCMGCVAAMATNTGLKEFEDFILRASTIYPHFSISAPWTNSEANAYLSQFGLKIGQTFYLRSKKFILDISNETLQSIQTIRSHPALVTIESENYPGTLHVLYWDGYQIYDPNPNVLDGRPLTDYKIVEWEPITPT